jgi:hypothetical protein
MWIKTVAHTDSWRGRSEIQTGIGGVKGRRKTGRGSTLRNQAAN